MRMSIPLILGSKVDSKVGPNFDSELGPNLDPKLDSKIEDSGISYWAGTDEGVTCTMDLKHLYCIVKVY
jgi:hypothetical protein